MRACLDACPGRDVVLDAQSPLRDLYAGFGFEVSGPEFLEDGIPHLPMRWLGPEQHLEGAAVAGGVEATDPHEAQRLDRAQRPTLNDATVTRKAAGANRSRPKASPAAIAARPSRTPRPVRSGRRPPPVSRARSWYAQPGTRPSGPKTGEAPRGEQRVMRSRVQQGLGSPSARS